MLKENIFYRNSTLITSKGTEIEPHSLWKKKGNLLILVDDDQYIEHALTDKFYSDTETRKE